MDETETIANRGFEGRTTRAIEKRTSRAPSGFYLALAVSSMAASAGILLSERVKLKKRPSFRARGPFARARFGRGELGGRSALANFVGQWAPTLLIIGLYNKVVKLEREIFPDVTA